MYVIYETYKLEFPAHNYIGKSTQNRVNRGYLGSGLILRQGINKYGKDAYGQRILGTYETEEEAFRAEKSFITKMKPYYNLAPGGTGGDTLASEPVRRAAWIRKLRESPNEGQFKKGYDPRRTGCRTRGKDRHNYYTHITNEEIARLHDEGLSERKIATALGCTRGLIQKRMSVMGKAPRDRNTAARLWQNGDQL